MSAARDDPAAITGTWSDLERRARYLYETADTASDAWEMAEAVLVLLLHARARAAGDPE